MSLLYECINGIIQGGILEGAEGTTEGDEIARLCVSKLRGMLVAAGDPNRESSPGVTDRTVTDDRSEICRPPCIHTHRCLASSAGGATLGCDPGMH